jgi:hypothetical protein
MQGIKTGNKDEAIRKRVGGEDELTQKYLGRIKSAVRNLPSFVLPIFIYILYLSTGPRSSVRFIYFNWFGLALWNDG